MNNNAPAGGNTPDLLSSIMGVRVRNEEKIAAEDREFCEGRQTKLYSTLHQLNWWYGLFTANAERYRDSHNVTYEENGSIDKSRLRNFYHNENSAGYSAFEFLPFKSINDVVKFYGQAVEAFGCDIVRYFNRKYGVSVPKPDFDEDDLPPPGFLPTYQTYVDAVIEHLGGKGFRETAEEELIARFHKVLMPYSRDNFKAELKGNKIVIPDVVWFENYSWQTKLYLSSGAKDNLNALCAGIVFGTTGSLNGNVKSISYLNHSDVDVSCRYHLIDTEVSLKLYKNRRIDFTFEDANTAAMCWKKLRLDAFKNTTGDE